MDTFPEESVIKLFPAGVKGLTTGSATAAGAAGVAGATGVADCCPLSGLESHAVSRAIRQQARMSRVVSFKGCSPGEKLSEGVVIMNCPDVKGSNSLLFRAKKTSLPDAVAVATVSGRECGTDYIMTGGNKTSLKPQSNPGFGLFAS